MRFLSCRSLVGVTPGVLLLGFSSIASITLTAAESPKDTFINRWKGSRVVVKQVLYTLTYAERGLTGNMSDNRRDGLTVITPFNGVYFQFDGRRSQDDIIEKDPRRIATAVTTKYQKTAVLDVGTYSTIEPISLERYETGYTLVVRDVRIDRDTVRLLFSDPASETKTGVATTLTVKWPILLSKSLSEHSPIDDLIRQFVEIEDR